MTVPGLPLRTVLARHRRGQFLLLGGGLLVLALAIIASTSLGVETMHPLRIAHALIDLVLPSAWTVGLSAWASSLLPSWAAVLSQDVAVIQNLRVPRTLMAVIGGAGLAMAGVAMQGITRNPLVSPFTVGISPAAAFGAALAILFGVSQPETGSVLLVASAFASATVCAAIVIGISSLRGMTPTVLILAGVGLTYLFGALTATVQFVATEQQLAAIIQWTFGSLNGTTWNEVAVTAAILAVVAPILILNAWALNAFAAGGDELAASLGFAVARTRLVVVLLSALITAAVVSFCGVIGFVGLVAPHIARLMIGADHRMLTPFSAITGALLLLVADTIGRYAFQPIVIPVGIVISYIGVPLFLHLIISRQKGNCQVNLENVVLEIAA